MTPITPNIIDSEQRQLNVSTWFLLFVLSYFFLYSNSGMFLTAFLTNWIYSIVVPSFAGLFGVTGVEKIEMTGSGDTPFDFHQVFFMLFTAFIASIVLLFLVKKKCTVDFFMKTVYMLVRYFVIYMMIIYGLSKVFYLQFQFPADYAMEVNLGDKSPMGLMWTFMGYSEGYTMFAGWLEFLAGLFLVFRRTTILGVLMTFGVMLNVFALNMFYDVPVKLFSFHIVLMSLFLLFPVRREIASFFLGRDKVTRDTIPFFDYGNYNSMMLWAKIGLLSFMLIRMGVGNYSSYKSKKNSAVITGKYEVVDQEFFMDGEEILDTSYAKIWESVPHLNRRSFGVKYKDGRERYFLAQIDTENQTIGLKLGTDPDSLYQMLNYTISDTSNIHISGNLYTDSISINLKKVEKEYLLKTRGFHWIQEYPYNR